MFSIVTGGGGNAQQIVCVQRTAFLLLQQRDFGIGRPFGMMCKL